MGLDKGVLTLSVLSKLPLTGKEQLTLLIIAKTHLMTDELAEPSTQKGLAPAVGSSEEKKNVCMALGRERGREDRDQWKNTLRMYIPL